MNSERHHNSDSSRRLSVKWQDSVWFPPVLAHQRPASLRGRRPILWPVQIITDPTVCAARTIDPIKL